MCSRWGRGGFGDTRDARGCLGGKRCCLWSAGGEACQRRSTCLIPTIHSLSTTWPSCACWTEETADDDIQNYVKPINNYVTAVVVANVHNNVR